MVYMIETKSKNRIYILSISFQEIYTLLGLALIVCTQLQLERKRQFYFCITLILSLISIVFINMQIALNSMICTLFLTN